jgi:hypothetical protein
MLTGLLRRKESQQKMIYIKLCHALQGIGCNSIDHLVIRGFSGGNVLQPYIKKSKIQKYKKSQKYKKVKNIKKSKKKPKI